MSDIPQTMKALRVEKVGASYYTLEDVPVPKPTGYEALVKISAAGLCHTDMMMFTGEFTNPNVKYPVIGSHEPSGTVLKLGEKADGDGVIGVGTRVAGLLPIGICHECPDCKSGLTQYCPNSLYTGITADGAFAEYEILDARNLVPLPDSMSFEQAAPMTCAGTTIYKAILRANLKPGQILAISGLGALGHLGAQMAKAMGLKVIGIDARPEPIKLAQGSNLAPDLCFDATKTTAEEAVKEIVKLRPEGYIGWDGADATLITSDPLTAQRYALDITRRHGLVVFVSQPENIQLAYHDLIFRDLQIVGTLHGTVDDLRATIELCNKHGIRSEVIAYKLDQHKEMVDSVHSSGRKGKSVLVF